jgi:hypothetical protein
MGNNTGSANALRRKKAHSSVHTKSNKTDWEQQGNEKETKALTQTQKPETEANAGDRLHCAPSQDRAEPLEVGRELQVRRAEKDQPSGRRPLQSAHARPNREAEAKLIHQKTPVITRL